MRRCRRSRPLRFPGNVRQLENICHWLTVMAPGQRIDAAGPAAGSARAADATGGRVRRASLAAGARPRAGAGACAAASATSATGCEQRVREHADPPRAGAYRRSPDGSGGVARLGTQHAHAQDPGARDGNRIAQGQRTRAPAASGHGRCVIRDLSQPIWDSPCPWRAGPAARLPAPLHQACRPSMRQRAACAPPAAEVAVRSSGSRPRRASPASALALKPVITCFSPTCNTGADCLPVSALSLAAPSSSLTMTRRERHAALGEQRLRLLAHVAVERVQRHRILFRRFLRGERHRIGLDDVFRQPLRLHVLGRRRRRLIGIDDAAARIDVAVQRLRVRRSASAARREGKQAGRSTSVHADWPDVRSRPFHYGAEARRAAARGRGRRRTIRAPAGCRRARASRRGSARRPRGDSTPCSSNRLKASADSTSAHL